MLVHHFPPLTRGLRPAACRCTALAEIRRIHVAAAWSTLSWPRRATRWLAMGLWPLVALVSVLVWQLPRHGRRAKMESGRPILLQLADLLRLAVTANLWPHHYYLFELYRPENGARAHEYLLRQETKRGIFTILKDDSLKNAAFARKDDFAAACAEAGLPHCAPIARIAHDGVSWSASDQMLPPVDLFVKPAAGQGGRGIKSWRWRDGAYLGADGVRETGASLLARLRRGAEHEDVLILPCLVNHAALAGLALDALSTLRIATCRDEDDRPEVVAAALRFPRRAGAIVDNFHAGGLAALVDLASGRLGPATDLGLARDSAWHVTHPVSGAAIEGFVAPHWREAKALAQTAHQALGDRVVIGWDVAILPDGPCLIEANGFPDLDIIQRCGRAPLGRSRLADLLALHLRRRYPLWRQRSGLPPE